MFVEEWTSVCWNWRFEGEWVNGDCVKMWCWMVVSHRLQKEKDKWYKSLKCRLECCQKSLKYCLSLTSGIWILDDFWVLTQLISLVLFCMVAHPPSECVMRLVQTMAHDRRYCRLRNVDPLCWKSGANRISCLKSGVKSIALCAKFKSRFPEFFLLALPFFHDITSLSKTSSSLTVLCWYSGGSWLVADHSGCIRPFCCSCSW